jgi:hypothetical protein
MGEIVGATGQVLGIDSDLTMVAAADRAALRAGVAGWTVHRPGQIDALPIDTGYFDGSRSERMFQHLSPTALRIGITEMARVTRIGGHLAVIDTDWATLSIDSTEPNIERRLVLFHSNRFPNGYAGRKLYRTMKEQGISDVRHFATVVPLDLPGIQFHLGYSAQLAVAARVISPLEANRWWSSLGDRAAHGTVFGQVALVMVVGRVSKRSSDILQLCAN